MQGASSPRSHPFTVCGLKPWLDQGFNEDDHSGPKGGQEEHDEKHRRPRWDWGELVIGRKRPVLSRPQ
jgi:hypothetical protein